MKIRTLKTPNEVAREVERLIRSESEARGKPLRIFLPTGRTYDPVYARMVEEKKYWVGKIKGLQIDEFIDGERLFFRSLSEKILKPLDIESSFWAIDPRWSDHEMLVHVETTVAEPIDIALLGLGPNGHVGFHEPGAWGRCFMGGRLFVSEETQKRVKGAKTREVFTFGVGAFLKASKIILAVFGEEKREALENLVRLGPTPLWPVTLLKEHPNFEILTDIKRDSD